MRISEDKIVPLEQQRRSAPFGQGRLEGRQEGRQEGELDLALRQLRRRCGDLTAVQEARVRSLPLERLEDLAEALLGFQGAEDLDTWLGAAV